MKLSREGGLGTQPILGKALNTSQGEDGDLRLHVQPAAETKGTHTDPPLYCFLTDTKTTRELQSIITKRVLNSLSINTLLLSDCVTSINKGIIVSALNLDLFPSVFLN